MRGLDYISRQDAMSLLGVCKNTLNKIAGENGIDSYKMGRKVFYRCDDINRAIAKHKQNRFA